MIPRIIKVCGMTQPDNIKEVEEAGSDWIGLIFWKGSARCISAKTPRPEIGQYIQKNLPRTVKYAGVFVDETIDGILAAVQAYSLDLIQLHGHEPADFCSRLQKQIHSKFHKKVPIIKAFQISTPEDLTQTETYMACCDYFLFDTKCSTLPGGSGISFDWNILSQYSGTTPFLLSGGIRPTDIGKILSFQHPACIGIDLNSRFERFPGLKDTGLLKTFIQTIRPDKTSVESINKTNK